MDTRVFNKLSQYVLVIHCLDEDRSPLVSDPPDLHEVLAGLTLDEIDLSQHSHDLLAEQAKLSLGPMLCS